MKVYGWIWLALSFAVLWVDAGETMKERDEWVVFDFSADSDIAGWEVEDDTVMGGVSRGRFSLDENGNAVFSGEVSLENNGGFSSVQFDMEPVDISEFETAELRIKGDGRRYQFRVESGRDERHAYIQHFETDGSWQTVTIPLASMYPSWRGNRLDLPNFDADSLGQVRFLIGNGKAESFRLEIDRIALR